ncbi:PREDICTED: uncharacterized protein LOC106308355 [Brassica oleracea var. oleracea]|uniref:uncharacterized protein LOC106308355 n=1 Tax=Brassica oleracea var. oleracea TaxID=109376 RepID=UPI0006A6DF85|nr:PREDICTED: uncharacterized protein LOC106308355 [Brassica oleracea var. oleracea]
MHGTLASLQVLLLDEVTVDLDVVARMNLLEFFEEECDQRGATIVYATHIFDVLETWATHLAYIQNGELNRSSKMADINEKKTSPNLLSVLRMKRNFEMQNAESLQSEFDRLWILNERMHGRELEGMTSSDLASLHVKISCALVALMDQTSGPRMEQMARQPQKFLCHDNKDPISRLAERQRCSSTPLQFDFFLFQESLEDSTTERRAAKPDVEPIVNDANRDKSCALSRSYFTGQAETLHKRSGASVAAIVVSENEAQYRYSSASMHETNAARAAIEAEQNQCANN